MEVDNKKIGMGLVIASLLLAAVLVVVKINQDKEGSFLCSLVENHPSYVMEEDCPAHNSPNSWLLLAAFAVSAMVLWTGIYLYMFSSKNSSRQHDLSRKEAVEKEEPINKKEINEGSLSEEEALIYNLIRSKEGSMYQSDIIKETEMTKVKVSRILDKLEGRGVLERKRRGMTNIVILK